MSLSIIGLSVVTGRTFVHVFVPAVCLFALSGSDRKFKPGLDRCAPVLRGSNKFASECVNVQGVWRERGQLFWNCPDGNGTEPKEDADRTVNSYTHTCTLTLTFKNAPKRDKKNFLSS